MALAPVTTGMQPATSENFYRILVPTRCEYQNDEDNYYNAREFFECQLWCAMMEVKGEDPYAMVACMKEENNTNTIYTIVPALCSVFPAMEGIFQMIRPMMLI